MPNKKTNDIKSELNSSELPLFALGNDIHIEVFSNKKIIIDGYFCVCEYCEDLISIRIKSGYLQITGTGLFIKLLGEDNVLITGRINDIAFL